MAEFGINVNYMITNNQATITGVSLGPAVGQTANEDCKTSVAANGDIVLDTADTAVLGFNLGNDDDWYISAVQLKDKDKTSFGAQPGGGNVLDDDEAEDFPGVSQATGTISYDVGARRASFANANKKSKTVNYRVQFTNQSTGQVIYSDPAVRDSGGAN